MKKVRVVFLLLVALIVGVNIGQWGYANAQASEENVYVGGYPVGISLSVGGLLVESVTGVETEYGLAAVEGLKTGDIIKKIDGTAVDSADDISDVLTDSPTKIELLRSGSVITVEVKPIIEAFSLKPKLGIKIKDTVFGVGTVTFVRENGSYAALGHEISEDSGTNVPFCGGNIHACKLVGIKRGERGEAGALIASLVRERVYGTISHNNEFGIGGVFSGDYTKSERVPLARRDEVRAGAAKIKTTISGCAEYYDIEIIKAVKQSGRKQKGMVIRITDRRLLDAAGGIVRGMSGSPILQNGKLVGAVTHVFLNDFTKGFGVYADCLN